MLQLCIFLLVFGILALTLELVMPGYDGFIGGILGVIALVVSAVLALMFLRPHGWIFVGINVSVLAVCFYFAYSFLQNRQGQGNLVLSETLENDPPKVDIASLIGKEGKAVTRLRPSGDADFGGIRVEVTTDGLIVERGTAVKVIEAQPNRILVSVVNSN